MKRKQCGIYNPPNSTTSQPVCCQPGSKTLALGCTKSGTARWRKHLRCKVRQKHGNTTFRFEFQNTQGFRLCFSPNPMLNERGPCKIIFQTSQRPSRSPCQPGSKTSKSGCTKSSTASDTCATCPCEDFWCILTQASQPFLAI